MGGFICTLIGVICKACVDALAGGAHAGDNAGFVSILFTAIAIILTLIGVLVTVVPAKPAKNKLIVLGIHAAIWVVGYFLLKIIVPIIVGAVVLCVVLTFLGFHPVATVLGWLSGTASNTAEEYVVQQPQPQPQQEVEVWQEQENGNMKKLRVNSSNDMYQDPETKEWHKIKK